MVKLSVADKQGGASSLKALENVEAGRSVTLTVCVCVLVKSCLTLCDAMVAC